MKSRLVIMCVAIFFGFSSAAAISAELTGTPDELRQYLRAETRTLSLSESATEKAYTDVARVTLIVSTEDRNMAEAMRLNNELRDSVRAAVVVLGIAEEDIQSSEYSSSPQFGWFGKRPSSFAVANSLVIKARSDEQFRGIAAIADGSDDIAFAGAAFEHSEKDAYEKMVRDKAIEAIMENRRYFSEKLGLTLVPVSFAYSDLSDLQNRRQNDYLEEIMVTGSRIGLASSAPAAAPAPTFDELEYRASVTVTFEVVDNE